MRFNLTGAPAGLLVALGVMAWLSLPGQALALFEEEMVPEDAWGARIMLDLVDQDSTVDKASRGAPLINYVIPDAEVRSLVEGGITRSIRRLDFILTFGMSDKWNLSLNVPFLRMEQDSSLVTTSDDPEVLAVVERLQSDSLSGFGDLELASWYRPVFTDWNAVVLGLGIRHPSGGQQSDYVGTPTFDLVSPGSAIFFLFHYTRYPAIHGARFDLRLRGEKGIPNTASVPGGEQKLDEGNEVSVTFGWSQEFGPVNAGLEGEFFAHRSNSLGGTRLRDEVRAQFLKFRLGFGNLAGLEEGAVAFPYRFDLRIESLESGSNLPRGNRLLLSLQTFF